MSEFSHYPGCRGKDPDNCSGCALTTGGPEGPNYAAWPLAYLAARRSIPFRWLHALTAELSRTDNPGYVDNIFKHIDQYGLRVAPPRDRSELGTWKEA